MNARPQKRMRQRRCHGLERRELSPPADEITILTLYVEALHDAGDGIHVVWFQSQKLTVQCHPPEKRPRV